MKPCVQDVKEITSALCQIHVMLTHLVGIEITQKAGLRDQVEALEGHAFQTVHRLSRAVTIIRRRLVATQECCNFQELLRLVLRIFFRTGPEPESKERRMARINHLIPRCGDELTQKFENMSVEQEGAEDEGAMDLM